MKRATTSFIALSMAITAATSNRQSANVVYAIVYKNKEEFIDDDVK